MDKRFTGTLHALEQYDRIDEPGLARLECGASAADFPAYVLARARACDRVRAAYVRDTRDVINPENVEVLSVDRIRLSAHGTVLGKLLALLP